MPVSPPLRVVCAVILNTQGQFLACQRKTTNNTNPREGKWEFPGGKVEPNESDEAALKREIREELAVNISALSALSPVTHHYPDLSIELHPFLCKMQQNATPQALEHEDIRWVDAHISDTLDWSDADLAVLAQVLKLNEI